MKNRMLFLSLCLSVLTLMTACHKNRDPDNLRESPKGDVLVDGTTDTGNWFIKDPQADGLEGVSAEKAMKDFALTNEKEIIVAVIDSGVEITHEDLQGKIWVNPGESGLDASGNDKATNGIDDDQDGHVDDVHGWNFLGGTDGKNIEHETLEMTRVVAAFEKRIAAGEQLTATEQAYFAKVKKVYDAEFKDADDSLKELAPTEKKATAAKMVLKDTLGLTDYSKASLEKITSNEADVLDAKATLLDVIAAYRAVARFYRIYDNAKNTLDYYLNKAFDPRAVIVGDDPLDFSQTHYGNNDVTGPDASHGTHVSGIIAAIRGNNKGIDGVAENVKIMVLRAVPDGDERDKDVALAIRYAADHGAQIVNMSFGKSFSPQKNKVDEAMLYAAEKGVLLFHAAGNSASNNDVEDNFPSSRVQDAVVLGLPEKISTWIEVGASSKDKGLNLAADFSSYGKTQVDLFSPGVELLSSVTGNAYAIYSGTSMATPAAAGTGALLMSNFKSMTATQAKAILLKQVRLYEGLEVHLPGAAALDLPVPFSALSVTGGVIDAYSSVVLAKQLSQ